MSKSPKSDMYFLRPLVPDAGRGVQIAEVLERFEPDAARWPLEVDSDAAERALATILERALNTHRANGSAMLIAGGTDTILSILTSPDASVTGRLNRAAAPLFDDGFFQAFEFEHFSDTNGDNTPFGLSELFQLLRRELPKPAEFDIETTQVALTEKTLNTDHFIQLRGEHAGRVVQLDMQWRVEWSASAHTDGTRWALGSIQVLQLVAVSTPQRLYDDCTQSIIGATDAWRTDLQHSAADLVWRNDRLGGIDIMCHTGLAIGDVNGDGRDDLYLCQSGSLPNRLFIQQADGTAIETAAASGVDFRDLTRAAVIVDLDNDGHRDLALSLRNATVLLRNDGNGQFSPFLKPLQTGRPTDFYSIAAIDLDGNKLLDLYTCRYVKAAYGISIPVPYHDARNGPANLMLLNMGLPNLADGTDRFGLDDANDRFSLAASWDDPDRDGDPDLVVANDFGLSNFYRNDAGRFSDKATEAGLVNRAAGMGVSWADFDGDGLIDLYLSNMSCSAGQRIMNEPSFRPTDSTAQREEFQCHARGNALFRNVDGTRFEAARNSGTDHAGWSWGGQCVDFNNDGKPDLLVPNGNLTGDDARDIRPFFWREVAPHSPLNFSSDKNYENGWAATTLLMSQGYSWSGRERNRAYLNIGNGRFIDVSFVAGFDSIEDGRALALTDWDSDGDVDVWIRNRTGPQLQFHRNNMPKRNWIEFDLIGATCNRDAIGARVEVTTESRRLVTTLRAGEGYLAQNSHRVHFGLGSETVTSARLVWPDGKESHYAAPAVNQVHQLMQDTAELKTIAARDSNALRIAAGGESSTHRPPRVTTLIEPLPLPDLAYTGRDGIPSSLISLFGKPSIILLWSAQHSAASLSLEQVAAAQATCKAADTGMLTLCVDASMPDEVPESLSIGVMSEPMRDVLDIAMTEIRALSTGVYLPCAFILDDSGRIVAVHEASSDTAAWLRDAAGAQAGLDRRDGTWLLPQHRAFGNIARQLAQRGHRELAMFYAQFAGRR